MPRTVRTCGECGRVNPGHWRNCSQYPSPIPAPASPDPELELLIAEEEQNEYLPIWRNHAAEAGEHLPPAEELQESIYRTVAAQVRERSTEELQALRSYESPRASDVNATPRRARISPAVLDEVRNSPWSTSGYDDDRDSPGPRQERPRNPNMNFTFLNAVTSPGPYAEYIGRARGFFSTYGDRRYSPNTLARLEQVADALRYGNDNITRPLLLVADNPVTFDPETESKSGGLAGMAVCWPMERTLVAVNRSVRQQGIGSNLLEQLGYQVGRGALTLWVGQSNVNGHRFCLSNGFIPTAMNGTGAVRYAVENSDV